MRMRVLIYAAIALAALIALLPEGLGGLLGYYYVTSRSMEPLIPLGSLIITHPPWLRPPRIGDVVVYRSERIGLISHRLVGVEGGEYIVQADAGGYVERVKPESVVGVAVLVIPFLGWVGISALISPLFPLAVAALLVAALIPGGPSRSLYPLSAGLSLLPSILPLNPAVSFLGPFSGYAYTALFLLGSASAYYADKRRYAPRWYTELVLTIIAITSVMVVRAPWAP